MENKSYAVPVVVAIAIIIIVGAIFFYKGPSNDRQLAAITESLSIMLQPAEDITLGSFREVDNTDKLWGNSTAPVKLVIYSDLECPACSWFHGQLKSLSDYVESGKVAIVFRHLPLDSIHQNARKLATAAECANSLGGNEKFWKFIDFVFAASDKSDTKLIGEAAKAAEVEQTDIEKCLTEKEASAIVESNSLEATTLGAQGTPFIIFVGPNGLKLPIFGGRETTNLKAAIDLILKNQEADEPTEEPVVEPTTTDTATTTATSTEN